MVILIWSLLFWVFVFALIKWLELKSHGRISRWLHARNISLYLGYVSWTTSRFNSTLADLSKKYRRWWDLWFSLGVTFGLVGLIFSVIILIGNLAITLTHVWFALTQSRLSSNATGPPVLMNQVNRLAVELNSQEALNSTAANAVSEVDSLPFVANYVDIEFSETMHRAEESVKHMSTDFTRSRGILTPLLPGINLPKSQMGYILFALVVSAVFHELGHALAAGAEELRVNGVGGFFAFLFPGAYVLIDGVDMLPPWRQLKVYCAGAWHNVAVAICCVLAIGFLPIVLFPFYAYHHGAVVTRIPANSVLRQHVFPGDVIKAVNSQAFVDRVAFFNTLDQLRASGDGGSFGFCFDPVVLNQFAKQSSVCCGSNVTAEGYQCFTDRQEKEQRLCMQPRVASLHQGCTGVGGCEIGTRDAKGSVCYFPILPDGQQLLDVQVLDAKTGDERHVIFQGMPETLKSSVILSNYLPRLAFLSARVPGLYELMVTLDVPKILDRMLQYTFSVSLCLAVLNMAPVFFLDGEARALLGASERLPEELTRRLTDQSFTGLLSGFVAPEFASPLEFSWICVGSAILFVRIFRPRMDEWMRQRLKSILLTGGTVLLAGNIVLSLAVLNL